MATIDAADVRKVVVACDAGMGSSVMLASTVRKRLAKAGVQVEHTPVDRIPEDADIVLCHRGLADRARQAQPGRVVVPFQLFIGDPAVEKVMKTLEKGGTIDG
jgi:mannitol-specific phosphotransferase system IIBC component